MPPRWMKSSTGRGAVHARFDPLYGALTDDRRWFPSPAHILRRAALLDACAELPPGRLLDLGCGAGRLLVDWHRRGHSGWGVDADPDARHLARQCVEAFGANFTIAATPPPAEVEQFDYLTIIEVLEHLPDPLEQLHAWLPHLREGGIAIASVPVFMRLWGKSDEWAGHVQRFEPDAFAGLMQRVGLQVLTTRLYGYPLANITRIAGNLSSAFKMLCRSDATDREAATMASGRDRTTESMLRRLLLAKPAATVLRMGVAAQRREWSDRRGIGIIAIARKPTPQSTTAV